ncbi:MAG: cell division protein SepF [Clostridia bacterium]|nr:cell division protein SepF [Clostridia bacterium]
MSFFDKILQGLGFEGEQPKTPVQEEKKTEVLKNKFDLSAELPPAFDEACGVYEFTPKNQEEVQKAIDFLKQGKSVQINFSAFLGSSMIRAMDFVQGACYALGVRPKKIADKVFCFEIKKSQELQINN